jgi:hypothetical protein
MRAFASADFDKSRGNRVDSGRHVSVVEDITFAVFQSNAGAIHKSYFHDAVRNSRRPL